jgi:hypothetical protein
VSITSRDPAHSFCAHARAHTYTQNTLTARCLRLRSGLRAYFGAFVASAAPGGGALAATAASASEPLAQWRLSGTPDYAYAILAAAGPAKGQMWVGAVDAMTASGKDASSQGGASLFDLVPQ